MVFKAIRFLLLPLIAALLCACTGFQNFIQDVSNKSQPAAAAPAAKPAQQCNQWCHNGWCSTHCEDVDNSHWKSNL